MKDKNVSKRRNFKSKMLAPANYLIVCEGTGINTESIVKYTEKEKQNMSVIISYRNILLF